MTAHYSPVQEARNREVYRLAKRAKTPKPLIESARALCATWNRAGKNYREIINLCKEVLAQESDYQLYTYLADALFQSGERYEKLDGFAVLDKALETCPPENLKARAELLINCAFWFRDYGNLSKSYELAQQAERLSTEIDDSSIRVSVLSQLACINCDFGYFDEGEELFREAKQLSQSSPSLENLPLLIVSTDAAFSLYWRDLDRRRTLEILEANSKLLDEWGSGLNYATINSLRAHIYYDAKAWKTADDLCTQSLDSYKRAGSIRGEAGSLILSATIDTALGRAGKAIEKYEAAIAIGEKLGHIGLLTQAHNNFGEFRLERQEYHLAERYFRNALSYSEEAENLFGIVNARLAMTRLAIAKKEGIPDAIEVCKSLLSDPGSSDYPLLMINVLNQLGDAHKESQEYDQAHQFYQQAMDIRAHRNYPGLSYAQFQLGQLYETQEKWEDALNYYQASLAIYVKNDNPDEQIGTLEAMANVCVKQNNVKQNSYSEALNYMDMAIKLRQAVDRTDSALIQSLFNKLDLLDKMGRLHASLSQLEEAERLLGSLESSYGKAIYLDQAAIYRCRLQSPEIALSYWEQTYQILLAEYQSTHIVTAFAQHKLAYGLIQISQIERAQECLRAAYAVLRTRLGGQHEIIRASVSAQADPHTVSAVFEKWSLMSLTNIDKQPLPDKSAEILRMVVGSDIVPIFDPDEGSQILDRIGKARFTMLEQEYFLFPNIRITDDPSIPMRDYALQLNEKEIFRGKLLTSYAIPAPGGQKPSLLNRKITQEPGFSFPLLWIDEEESQLATGKGIYSAEEIVLANIIKIIKRKKEQILAAI